MSEDTLNMHELYQLLKHCGKATLPWSLNNPHSYRGSYDHVAFQLSYNEGTPMESAEVVLAAIGRIYYGWKGGEFQMGYNTPVHFACEGSCSDEDVTEQYVLDLLAQGTD